MPAYGLQGTFGPTISSLMHTYNTAPPSDELTRAQTELNQVKDIMVQNVEQILSRGERIELLVDKTDAMAGQATAFRRGARSVRRQMWWKNKKVLGLGILAGLVCSFLCQILVGWLNIRRFCCGLYWRSFVAPVYVVRARRALRSYQLSLIPLCYCRIQYYSPVPFFWLIDSFNSVECLQFARIFGPALSVFRSSVVDVGTIVVFFLGPRV